ncbi:hypothetical protein GC197_08575 [bacterium]|nr:hypothetical protein [bacterium]
MPDKQPVLLTVLLECHQLRWYAASIDQAGVLTPLLCSPQHDLAGYIGQPFDDQASYLRHRLAGVLQRGCDRLWGKMMKPRQVVFVADSQFPEADPSLTQRVADHFYQWMTSPPIVFYMIAPGSPTCNPKLMPVVGDLLEGWQTPLDEGFPKMITKCSQSDPWELVLSKPSPG